MVEQDMGTDEDVVGSEESLPFRLSGLDQLPPEFANFVQTSYDRDAFHVAFARIINPILVNDEDRRNFMEQGWIGEVVSRLIIPPHALGQMISYLQQQLVYYAEQYEPPHTEPEDASDES